MPLPKAVEEAAKKADEMLKALQVPPENAPQEEPAEEPAAEEPKIEEPAPEPAPEEEPKEEPKVEAKAEPKAPEVDTKEYERLKQSHNVLQGKYNAEIPRLYAQIKELEAQLAANAKPAPPPTEAQPKNIEGFLSKLAEEYGDEFAQNVRGAITEEVKNAMGGMRTEVENVKNVVVKSKEERFLADLSGLVPNWREIYNDPGFSEFLEQEDSFSGKPLRELAVEANNSLNAQRLAKFYNAYAQQSAPKTVEPEKPKVDKREALLTPNSSPKPAASAGGEKPDYIKASDVQKFYSDISRGVYEYRPKEKEAMNERINRAIAKNWVTAG